MSEHSGKVGGGPARGGPDKQWAVGRDGLETGGPQHSPRRRERKAFGFGVQFGYAAGSPVTHLCIAVPGSRAVPHCLH